MIKIVLRYTSVIRRVVEGVIIVLTTLFTRGPRVVLTWWKRKTTPSLNDKECKSYEHWRWVAMVLGWR